MQPIPEILEIIKLPLLKYKLIKTEPATFKLEQT